ncbi:IPT/TIG domain-containing protein [Actinoplanes sp. L3-i22]|uniref:IPT/TIG domain-containing protein n=1 Tax=Actinoplanes sp. L3-i22 TaxID=2836373 RepID=UPI001C774897|nr:IPT/TIG domain-containing protein [Actinoplanes sp. L3-i22]BCY10663.1 hypothetical protein L3i22_057510 [Actinoplanes sp. L3-i22]
MATPKQARRAAALTVATAAAVTLASAPAVAVTRAAGAHPSAPVVSVRADKPSTKVPTGSAVLPGFGSTAGGTTVTITGSGFSTIDISDPAAVKFGDVNAASYVVISDAKLTAVTPAGDGGNVYVKITNVNGTSTGKLTFAYRTPLTAEFESLVGAKPAGGTVLAVTVSGGTVGTSTKEFAAEKVTARVGETNTTVGWVDPTHVKVLLPASMKIVPQTITLIHDGVIGPVSESTVRYAPAVTSIAPAKVSTAGGETVTITGAGFSDEVTGVTIGGVAATSFAVKSATQITAVVPAGENGTVPVVVTSAGGTGTIPLTYRAPLGIEIPDGTAARANGGTVLLTVTGATIGATAAAFANEKITATVGSAKISPAWVDATHVRVAMPASSAAAGTVTLLHDGVAGAPAAVDYVPVVASLSGNADKLAGGAKVIVKIAGGEPTSAKDFKFGGVAATCSSQGAGAYACIVPAAEQAGPTWVTFTASSGTASRFTPQATFNYTDLD